jgi:hypothetical protein
MPRKRNSENPCSKHTISLCGENRATVISVRAEIEKKHQTSIDEAINLIIEKYRELK